MSVDFRDLRKQVRKNTETGDNRGLFNAVSEGANKVAQQAEETVNRGNRILEEEGYRFGKNKQIFTKKIHFDLLDVDPENRDAKKNIEKLKEDIKTVGFLINTMWVYEKNDGRYMIINGERRYHSIEALRSGTEEEQKLFEEAFMEQPYIVCSKEMPLTTAKVIAFIDNDSREPLDREESLRAVNRLKAEYERRKSAGEAVDKKIHQYIARQMNVSQKTAKRDVNISEHLIPELMEMHKSGKIGVLEADELSGMGEEMQKRAADILNKIEMTNRDTTAEIIKAIKTGEMTKQATAAQIDEKLDNLRKETMKFANEEREGIEKTNQEKIQHAENLRKISEIDEYTEEEPKKTAKKLSETAETKVMVNKLKKLVYKGLVKLNKANITAEDKEEIKEVIEALRDYVE